MRPEKNWVTLFFFGAILPMEWESYLFSPVWVCAPVCVLWVSLCLCAVCVCVSVCLFVLCCVCQRATQRPSLWYVLCSTPQKLFAGIRAVSVVALHTLQSEAECAAKLEASIHCPCACEQARVSGVDASVTILHESPAGSDHNQRIISFSGNDSSLFNASPVSLTQPVPLANKSSPFAINASSISPQTEAVQRPERNLQNRDASEIPHSRMARGAIQLSPKESRSDRAGTQDSDQAKETRKSESSERGTSRQCISNASPSPSQRWAPYVYIHTHNS